MHPRTDVYPILARDAKLNYIALDPIDVTFNTREISQPERERQLLLTSKFPYDLKGFNSQTAIYDAKAWTKIVTSVKSNLDRCLEGKK